MLEFCLIPDDSCCWTTSEMTVNLVWLHARLSFLSLSEELIVSDSVMSKHLLDLIKKISLGKKEVTKSIPVRKRVNFFSSSLSSSGNRCASQVNEFPNKLRSRRSWEVRRIFRWSIKGRWKNFWLRSVHRTSRVTSTADRSHLYFRHWDQNLIPNNLDFRQLVWRALFCCWVCRKEGHE